MNDRNFDQLLNAWMDLGPTTAPERVADAARLEAAATRQLPAVLSRWAPRRFPVMNTTAKVILATAAVALAVVARLQLSRRPECRRPEALRAGSDSDPSPSPALRGRLAGFRARAQHCSPDFYRLRRSVGHHHRPDDRWESNPSAWYKAMCDWGPWHQSNRRRLPISRTSRTC